MKVKKGEKMSGNREKVRKSQEYMKEYFNELMDSVSEDLLITDGSGIVLRVSPSFEQVYGLDSEAALGRTVYDLEAEGYFRPSIIAKVLASGNKVTMEQTTKKDRIIVVTATPVRNRDGKIRFVVSYSRDITEEIDLQKKYASLQDQMERYSSEISKLKSRENNVDIIRNSHVMEQVMETVAQVAEYDVNVLLLGDSGTGKTSLARKIHYQSSRADRPFVDINCAAIPEHLLEAELFGYEKGAFTGADARGKTGLIEMAHHGTLFLDEVSEIPLPLQAKILKAIQEKEIIRVGSVKPVKVDFRLIAATNQDLEQSVQEGKFRKDLYYRLNVIRIRVPSIRERKEDVAPLLEHFLEQCNERFGKGKRFSAEAMEALVEWDWPGNVREISNVVERCYITSSGAEIGLRDLPEEIREAEDQSVIRPGTDETLAEAIERLEKSMVRSAYERYGSTTAVAKHLGISQPTASRKISKYVSADEGSEGPEEKEES